MTNPTYTDEQVREHAAWQVGETRKMMLQLLADRQRLQADAEALRNAMSKSGMQTTNEPSREPSYSDGGDYSTHGCMRRFTGG